MSAHKGFPLWLVALALAIGLFLLLTGSVVAQAPVVNIQPSTTTVAPNEQVSFVVTVTQTSEISPSVPLEIEVRWEPATAVANAVPRESRAELEEDRISWVFEAPETITTTVAFTLQVGSEPGELLVTAKATNSGQAPEEVQEQIATVQIESEETTPPDATVTPPDGERADLTASQLTVGGTDAPADQSQIPVRVELVNSGPGEARGVQFSLTQDPPTQLNLTTQTDGVERISTESGETIEFRVGDPIPPGESLDIQLDGFVVELPADQTTGELRLVITADNADNVELTDTFEAPARPNVVIRDLRITPDTLVAEGEMALIIELHNRSSFPLKDLAVSVRTVPEVQWLQQPSDTFPDIAIEPKSTSEAVIRMSGELPPQEAAELALEAKVPAHEGNLVVTAGIFELPNNQAPPDEISWQVDRPIEPAIPPTQPATAEPTAPPTAPVTATTTLTPTTSEQPPGGGTSDDGGLPTGLVPLLFVAAALLLVALIGVWYSRRQPSPAPASGPAPARARPPLPAAPVAPPYQPSTRLEAVTVPGLVYRLQKEVTTIGRAEDCDVKIDQRFLNWETVSRHHAEIRREGEQWIIYDMQSTNGVFVERRRTVKNLLRHGWRIGIGGVEFIFHEDVSRSPGGIEA